MSATAAANAAAAAAWVAALAPAAGGRRHAVLSPGSRSTPLALALADAPHVEVHVVLDERAAAFVALGAARAAGQASVLVCTSGSAGTHYAPAVAEAHAAAVPLLVCTANRPPELQQCGAAQTLDQTRLYGSHACFFAALPVPEAGLPVAPGAALVRQALAAAEGGPGVAHLDVPFREPLWDAAAPPPPPPPAAPPPPPPTLPAQLPAALVAALATALRGAGPGWLVCGPRPPSAAAGFGAAVRRLAAALGWPLLAEATSQARDAPAGAPAGDAGAGPPVDDAAPVCVAHDAWLRTAAARAVAPAALLRFGAFPTGRPLTQALQAAAAGRGWLVAPRGRRLDPTAGAAQLLLCDELWLCAALTTALQALPPPPPAVRAAAQRTAELERRAQATLAPRCRAAPGPLWSGAVARQVAQALRPGDACHVASSLPVRDLDAFGGTLPADVAVYHGRGVSGIDGTLAGGIGEALAGATPLTVLLGDLAFWHDVGALQLAPLVAARQLTAVVVNNGGGGIFDFLPIAAHPAFGPLFRAPQGGDVGAVCGAFGVPHAAVTDALALARALRAPHPGGLRVIEAVVPPGPAAHQAAWAAVAAATEAPPVPHPAAAQRPPQEPA